MKISKRKIAATGALMGAFLYLHAAPAAETLPEPLRACITIKRDSERLACYDRAVAGIESGSPTASASSPENMFGAHTAMAAQEPAAQDARREELKQITGQVVSVGRSESGQLELALDNNQVWRQQESETTLVIQTGDSVTISRASLGTFRITDKRGRSARFKRVR